VGFFHGPTAPQDRPHQVSIARESGRCELTGGRVLLQQMDEFDVGSFVGQVHDGLVPADVHATPRAQKSLDGHDVFALHCTK